MIKKQLHRFLIFSFILSSLVTIIIQNNHTYAQDKQLEVSGEILYLRDGPGLTYGILETLKQGEQLSFIEQNGDWIHVKVNDKEGWVASWLTTSVETNGTTENKTVISQVDHLNIRSEPTLSSAVLGQLATGQQATIKQQQNNWIQIEVNDITGWVSNEYVAINENEKQATNATTEKTTTQIQTDSKQGIHYFTIQVDAVIIRDKADLNAQEIATAKKAESYKILKHEGNWLQIQLSKTQKGWVYSFYGTFSAEQAIQQDKDKTKSTKNADDQFVTIIYNGTNLREEPTTDSAVATRADAGQAFKILAFENDWYEVETDKNKSAYVASWVVTVTNEMNNQTKDKDQEQNETPRKKGTLKGVTIVVDAGHGGNDRGTTGARGTDEKNITLQTATTLESKLKAAGAEVIMTRESDEYVDLRQRVSIAHQHNADAFISLHYDATEDSSISGFTTYFMNSNQQELAQTVHAALSKKIELRDRGAQPGNYLVLRENRQPAILIELGYLSNPSEEREVLKSQFREQATLGIYKGILNYFDAQLSQ